MGKTFKKPKWANGMSPVVEAEAKQVITGFFRTYEKTMQLAMEESEDFIDALVQMLSGSQAMYGAVRDVLVESDAMDLVRASDKVAMGMIAHDTMGAYMETQKEAVEAAMKEIMEMETTDPMINSLKRAKAASDKQDEQDKLKKASDKTKKEHDLFMGFGNDKEN